MTSTTTSAVVSLEPDHLEIREALGSICLKYPAAYWRGLEDANSYPTEFIDDLTAGGFLAALIPEEFGGGGASLRAAAVILETINRHGCSASQGHAQMYIMATLLRHGSDEQKRRYLPRIASGELRLQAFGVTEPTTGSDTTQIKTRADREGDEYVIHGQKVWTSRALHSDLMLLLARTTPAEACARRTDGLSVFLVDLAEARRQGGLEIRPLDAMINHNTTEIFLDGVRVPAENLVGREGKGFRYILDGLNAERTFVASEAVGDGRFFLDMAVRYANERVVFGRPIGQNQGIQFPLARAYAELEAADMMARRAAALFDAGQPCGSEANIAKLLASEACWHAGEAAMQTFGGFAFAREFNIERKWRESRVYQIAPVSTNMVLGHIAQHVLGLPRSY
jgi:acyl-CoA dehydrogenase